MTNSTIDHQFHSGKRLQKLRELEGLSIIELAETLTIDATLLSQWEASGVPPEYIQKCCHYFEVSRSLFTDPVTSEIALSQLVEGQLFPQNTARLKILLQDNQIKQTGLLDLSGLGLNKIPDEVFQFYWLTELNLSDNKLIQLPCKIVLLQHLKILNISNNLLQHLPGSIDALHGLEQLVFQGNPLQVQEKLLNSAMSLETYQTLLTENKVTLIVVDQLTPDCLTIIENIRGVIERIGSLVIVKHDEVEMAATRYAQVNNLVYLSISSNSGQLTEQIKPWLPLLHKQQFPFWVLFDDIVTSEQYLDINKSLVENFPDNALLFKLVDNRNQNEFKEVFDDVQQQLAYQDQLPTIRFERLILNNIGVYEHIEISFNQDITVLIGLNGAGKSTIIKALAIATLGAEQAEVDNDTVADLLRITGKEENNTIRRQEGSIRLLASVNGISCENCIRFVYNINTEKVEIHGSRFEQLFDTNGHLRNLMLGISEQRNTNTKKSQSFGIEVPEPKVKDLLPIINGEEQACISHFTAWLGNLALSVSQGDSKKQQRIDVCFAIFSKLMQEQIQFAGITLVDPLELWVKHQNPQQLIPLRLASQGYQAVMGWIGLIIQRMFEAYEKTLQPLQQSSIIIIDEIDQLLHVKWQQKILTVLAKEFFPNTQWIITTHSPMVITGLDREQVIQLHQCDGKLVAEPNSVDLWLWQYGDVVRHFFEISALRPAVQEKQLIQDITQMKNIAFEQQGQMHKQALNKLEQHLEKAQESRAFIDVVYAEQQKLRSKEQELSQLIKQLSQQQSKG
jgi:predicted ATP-binding protein involved in virulence/transcriptional regulator with XRE-family HTH domain